MTQTRAELEKLKIPDLRKLCKEVRNRVCDHHLTIFD